MMKSAEDKANQQKELALEKDRERALRKIKSLGSDEDSIKGSLSLTKILGGDILTGRMIRSQIWLIVIVVVFLVVYISNRYSSEQEIQQIDNLQKELVDARYKALSAASQLTERSRQSKVIEILRQMNDSVLHIPDQPPFIIRVEK